jgi:para-aminobenzoate synthetase component 1
MIVLPEHCTSDSELWRVPLRVLLETAVRFGISSLLILVLASSIICGIALQGSFLAFAIGFVALAFLLARLTTAGPRSLTVRETTSEVDAAYIRDYLTAHGVTAWIEGSLAMELHPTVMLRPRVVVPERQAELAGKIMQQLGVGRGPDVSEVHRSEAADAVPSDPVPVNTGNDTPATANATSSASMESSEVCEIAWPEDIPSLLRRFSQAPHMLFFDSARVDSHLGRYSFLTADPFEFIRSRGGQVIWSGVDGQPQVYRNTDPLAVLSSRLSQWTSEARPDLPPFQGGAAGLFSYDLCHQFEKLPRPEFDDSKVPDVAVGIYDWVVALDHERRRAWIIATGHPAQGSRQRRHRAAARVAQVQDWIRGVHAQPHGPDAVNRDAAPLVVPRPSVLSGRSQWPIGDAAGPKPITSNFSRDQYLRTVERAIAYIVAGDVYQVNLAQRLVAPLHETPVDLYVRLREQNPAPFAGYFDLGELVIASASPERFLRVDNGEVETRPIKGTRPRWPVPEADMYSAGELRESDKDRAENVMIVDLLRNDLGRVCEFGSVRVTDSLRLESYQYVHHLVSEVRGRLRAECGAIDLLRAAFPGGSVTGAPKIRAMEIIAELEPHARGAYCGSIGYIGFDGSMDTNILIRTFTCGRGWVHFPVGGGIVAQSEPEREYEETLHKAAGLIRSLKYP